MADTARLLSNTESNIAEQLVTLKKLRDESTKRERAWLSASAANKADAKISWDEVRGQRGAAEQELAALRKLLQTLVEQRASPGQGSSALVTQLQECNDP